MIGFWGECTAIFAFFCIGIPLIRERGTDAYFVLLFNLFLLD